MSKRTLKKQYKSWVQTGRGNDHDELEELNQSINEINQSIDELNQKLIKKKLKRDKLKRNIKKTLSKASKIMRRGFNPLKFNTECTQSEYARGAIRNNMICSETSRRNKYAWRAIGNVGDIHNRRSYVRRRPIEQYHNDIEMHDKILAYENESVNPYKQTKTQAALTIQDTPYIRNIMKPRIFKEANRNFNSLQNIDEELDELDEYHTPPEEFDDFDKYHTAEEY